MGRRSDHSREELYELALATARRIVEKDGPTGLTARKVAGAMGYGSQRPCSRRRRGRPLRGLSRQGVQQPDRPGGWRGRWGVVSRGRLLFGLAY